jgi:hypothetical protein
VRKYPDAKGVSFDRSEENDFPVVEGEEVDNGLVMGLLVG